MGNTRKPAWKQDKQRNRQPRQSRKNRVGPLEVAVINGDIERAIRELKNKMSKEGILTELKYRRFAEKPSEKKRRRHREALKKVRKSRGRKARQRTQVKNKE
jgi:small subunit ribosomal protein S21